MTPPNSQISALPQDRLRSALSGWLFWLAAFAVIIAVMAATPPPRLSQRQASANAASTAAHPREAPAPPPMILAPVAEEDARMQNAAIPLVSDGFSKPAPFFYAGAGDDLARAIDCVAAAMLYEAGDDARGQRAVGQVIINRARHAAFPKSLCAVVFQGSERVTGCQFTFTCDGALARRYSDGAWTRAQGHARQMLNGSTADEVGLATHYHTDWVRPYWSDTLSKIAIIDTHLFFRWPGFWGTRPAFRHAVAGREARITKMMPLSAAHAGAALPIDAAALQDEDAMSAAKEAQIVTSRKQQASRDTILVELDTKASPEAYLIMALRLCGERDYCKLFGWTNPTLKPSSEAMSDLQRAAMSFSYLRDDKANFEKPLWNCTEFKRDDPRQCMKR
jgi:spore germination cell wall hydrolase CwlJ-like protein